MEYNRYLPYSSAPHLDQMQQFDDSWISAAFEAAAITMRPEINIPQNQSTENNHGFSLPGDCNFSSTSAPPSPPHLDQILQFDDSWLSSYFSDDDAPFEPPEMNIQQNQSIEINHGFSLPGDRHLPSSSVPPPHLDQNPDPAMPSNQMQPLDDLWTSAAFEPSAITMPPEMNIPQNQSIENNQGFSLPGESKTEAEIALDNYLKIYSAVDDPLSYLEACDFESNYADPSSIEPVANSSSKAEFDLSNYNYASMTNFSQFNHLNIEDIEIQLQNLSTPSVKSLPPKESLPPPPPPPSNAIRNRGRASGIKNWNWCIHEHNLFLVGLNIFGKGDWKNIANKVVFTKSHIQVASHAQKYFNHQDKKKEDRKRRSIHDINTVDPVLLMQVRASIG